MSDASKRRPGVVPPIRSLFVFLALVPCAVRGQVYGPYSQIHIFGGSALDADGLVVGDGAAPQTGPVTDRAGNLFGTTYVGGRFGSGLVWELKADGSYLDLHDFGGQVQHAQGQLGPDGVYPAGALSLDSEGDLYGTTDQGGLNYGGILFEITAGGAYRALHDFGGSVSGQPDGYYSVSNVVFDSRGNAFGMTNGGGKSNGGVIWEIAKNGSYGVLHSFGPNNSKSDASAGYGSLTVDKHGSVFGCCSSGGPQRSGALWEIDASGTYKVLHFFGGTVSKADGRTGPDGVYPDSGVAMDENGDLYGTTLEGGAGGGISWEFDHAGRYKDLHDFGLMAINASGQWVPDGFNPAQGSVLVDPNGNVYGVCSAGGSYFSRGNLWEYSRTGEYLDLHDFGSNLTEDGGYPFMPLVMDGGGDLLGACQSFGVRNAGNVFMLTRARGANP
jgi:uncharacterized repeat protein (TIGR03803 family)